MAFSVKNPELSEVFQNGQPRSSSAPEASPIPNPFPRPTESLDAEGSDTGQDSGDDHGGPARKGKKNEEGDHC